MDEFATVNVDNIEITEEIVEEQNEIISAMEVEIGPGSILTIDAQIELQLHISPEEEAADKNIKSLSMMFGKNKIIPSQESPNLSIDQISVVDVYVPMNLIVT